MRSPNAWAPLILLACRGNAAGTVDSEGIVADTDAAVDTDTDAAVDTDGVDTDVADTDVYPPGPGWTWGEDNDVADADGSLVGEVSGEGGGMCLSRVPNDQVGGDVEDLLVALPYHGSHRGRVFRVFGGPSWGLATPLVSFPYVLGDGTYSELCRTVTGDFDGDELVAVIFDEGYHTTVSLGRTLGVRGGTWASPSPPWVRIDDDTESVDLDAHVPVGDLDGDGLDDVVLFGIGSVEAFWVSGADLSGDVRVPADAYRHVVGPTGLAFSGDQLGDLDGDGFRDVVAELTSRSASFGVYGFGGRSGSGEPEPADEAAFLQIGCEARCFAHVAGDLDGDGADELVVSAESDAGLFYGRSDWSAVSTLADADLEVDPALEGISPVGDLDGDGVGDFAAVHVTSAYANDVAIWFGGGAWPAVIDATSADVLITGVGQSGGIWRDPYGHAPDLDGDGLADLVLQNSGLEVDGLAQAGGIAVYTGRTTWPRTLGPADADVRFVGRRESGWFGQIGYGFWLGILDLNGDGRDDLAVFDTTDAPTEGEVVLFLGHPR